MKRLFDITFCLLFFPIILLLFLLIALITLTRSPGNIFYVQIRLGRDGKPFKCYKFRTMHIGADLSLKKILEKNPQLHLEWIKNQKLKSDPRIFPFGHFLRKTSLDELPQFWNVIKGDLSVVGPRPYMVAQRKELGAWSEKILSMRPGITGLWQTSGRNGTTFQERIALDAQYVDKHSFWYDLRLIIKTIPEVFFSKNAC